MSNKKHNGITLHGNAGVPYRVFAFSYVINDKYHLSVYSGNNMRTGSKVTIIPFESSAQDVFEDRLQYFRKRDDLHWVDSSTRDKTNYVIFDILPAEFENIYLNLPVAFSSQNTPKNNLGNSQAIVPVQDNEKHKNNNQKKKNHSNPKGIWIGALLLSVACGISIYLAPNLFTQYPQPTNTNEIVSAASFTLLPVITETYTQSPLTINAVVPSPTATNTIVQITPLLNTLTLTPSIAPPSDTLTPTLSITSTIGPIKTETATIVPTRTGLPGTVYLCPAESGRNVRAVPSTQNNSPLGSLQKKDCLYYEGQFTDNNGMFWVKIALNETKFPGGWVAAGNPTSKPPTIYLIGNDFSALPTPAIPPITSTPTSTPKITPAP